MKYMPGNDTVGDAKKHYVVCIICIYAYEAGGGGVCCNGNFRAKIHVIFGQNYLICGQALDKTFEQETSSPPPPPAHETDPVRLW